MQDKLLESRKSIEDKSTLEDTLANWLESLRKAHTYSEIENLCINISRASQVPSEIHKYAELILELIKPGK